MKLITYGCGPAFVLQKFNPVKNHPHHFKPIGGLWASPVDSDMSWKSWCEHEGEIHRLSSFFEFEFFGKLLTIDGYEDLIQTQWRGTPQKIDGIDFEWALAQGFDGIYLTGPGQIATRTLLYGWDCECVFVMNPIAIKHSSEQLKSIKDRQAIT